MASSSLSPVSFVKSATATVGRPPGICRSQTRQVAKPARARPTADAEAGQDSDAAHATRPIYQETGGAKLREPCPSVLRPRCRVLGKRRPHGLRHRSRNTG